MEANEDKKTGIKLRLLLLVIAIIAAVFAILYKGDTFGKDEDDILNDEIAALGEREYTGTLVTAEEYPVIVGMVYKKEDYSDARWFAYVQNKHLPDKWILKGSGELKEENGLICLDCVGYGRGFVALNKNRSIAKIVYTDGTIPYVEDNIDYPIVCLDTDVAGGVHFYDKDDNEASVIMMVL